MSKKGRDNDVPKPARPVPPEPDPELVQVLRKDESSGQKNPETERKQMVE